MTLPFKTPSPKPPRVIRLGRRATHIRMALKLSTLTGVRRAFWIAGFQFLALGGAVAVFGVDDASRAVVLPAGALSCLHGAPEGQIAILACSPECAAIPWQLDERDPGGRYVLDSGPAASSDVDGGAVDDNDDVVFMWSDAGGARTAPLPGTPACVHAVEIEVGPLRRWVYAARYARATPRSMVRYVEYDVAADVMRGRSVEITFAGPTPRGLALRAGPMAGRSLLDRLKVRASARFFGIFPLSRDEDDISSIYEAWRVGPVRVLRRERKWVHLAFGYRTPYLDTETTFYRDFVQLPVRMRLNFAPAQLLSHIQVRAALDFVDLRGWRFAAPGALQPFAVGDGAGQSQRGAIDAGADAEVIALQGPDATFALVLRLGPTLRSISKNIVYEEAPNADAPERVAGQMPAIGFRLTDWGDVERGEHWFVAESYALPANYDLDAFAAGLAVEPGFTVTVDSSN